VLLLLPLLALAQAPLIDERWDNPTPPTVGEGEGEGAPALTVVVRGASHGVPIRAQLGEVQGELQYLGQAIFALTLRGVPAEGEAEVWLGERLMWKDRVLPGEALDGEALVLLEQRGNLLRRVPGDRDPPPAPGPRAPWLPVAWILGTLALAWKLR